MQIIPISDLRANSIRLFARPAVSLRYDIDVGNAERDLRRLLDEVPELQESTAGDLEVFYAQFLHEEEVLLFFATEPEAADFFYNILTQSEGAKVQAFLYARDGGLVSTNL